MKKIRYLILSIITLIHYQSFSQSDYLAGTAQSSIEPDQSLISLHLGGYGAPREGRFTLQWISKGNLPETSVLTGLNDRLYIVSRGELLYMIPSEANPSWKPAGKAENIICIAGSVERLYAINSSGELLETASGSGVKWKKIGDADGNITTLAAINKTLFASDGKGSLYYADLQQKGY